jgi:UDP-2,3-diacylglucosamine pyrophosphatase LpxH
MPRTKKVFISDIHLGDERSMTAQNPYCWCNENIGVLEGFLDEQLQSTEVKEVAILGDLFDTWVVPTNYEPLTSFAEICANPANERVIHQLKALAAHPEIKLAYVPGNHDMGMDMAGISATRQFLESAFPGMRYFCNSAVPLGTYNVGSLAAEHGNRYCLFNAPDMWAVPDSFLPLGYFISRVVAYKVWRTGDKEDPRDIFFNFLRNFMYRPNFVEDMFNAIAKDAGLKADAAMKLNGVPGYTEPTTVGDIGRLFHGLIHDWKNTSGNVDLWTAVAGDLANLAAAASQAYFSHFGSNVNIVIFGHTHIPFMDPTYEADLSRDGVGYSGDDPCRQIYANCGTWVDQAKHCTYVETEEVADKRRHYVRVKKYPENEILDGYEGFVRM